MGAADLLLAPALGCWASPLAPPPSVHPRKVEAAPMAGTGPCRMTGRRLGDSSSGPLCACLRMVLSFPPPSLPRIRIGNILGLIQALTSSYRWAHQSLRSQGRASQHLTRGSRDIPHRSAQPSSMLAALCGGVLGCSACTQNSSEQLTRLSPDGDERLAHL